MTVLVTCVMRSGCVISSSKVEQMSNLVWSWFLQKLRLIPLQHLDFDQSFFNQHGSSPSCATIHSTMTQAWTFHPSGQVQACTLLTTSSSPVPLWHSMKDGFFNRPCNCISTWQCSSMPFFVMSTFWHSKDDDSKDPCHWVVMETMKKVVVNNLGAKSCMPLSCVVTKKWFQQSWMCMTQSIGNDDALFFCDALVDLMMWCFLQLQWQMHFLSNLTTGSVMLMMICHTLVLLALIWCKRLCLLPSFRINEFAFSHPWRQWKFSVAHCHACQANFSNSQRLNLQNHPFQFHYQQENVLKIIMMLICHSNSSSLTEIAEKLSQNTMTGIWPMKNQWVRICEGNCVKKDKVLIWSWSWLIEAI